MASDKLPQTFFFTQAISQKDLIALSKIRSDLEFETITEPNPTLLSVKLKSKYLKEAIDTKDNTILLETLEILAMNDEEENIQTLQKLIKAELIRIGLELKGKTKLEKLLNLDRILSMQNETAIKRALKPYNTFDLEILLLLFKEKFLGKSLLDNDLQFTQILKELIDRKKNSEILQTITPEMCSYIILKKANEMIENTLF